MRNDTVKSSFVTVSALLVTSLSRKMTQNWMTSPSLQLLSCWSFAQSSIESIAVTISELLMSSDLCRFYSEMAC